MTYNLIAYFIYLSITFFIIIKVGWICYTNGEVFILQVIGDEEMTMVLNRILLAGYYLVNLGYLAMSIYDWKQITDVFEMLNLLSERIGLIVLVLAI